MKNETAGHTTTYERVPIPQARGKVSVYFPIWEALLETKGRSAIKVIVEPTNLRKVISALSARCRVTKEWRLRSQMYEHGTLLWIEKKVKKART